MGWRCGWFLRGLGQCGVDGGGRRGGSRRYGVGLAGEHHWLVLVGRVGQLGSRW